MNKQRKVVITTTYNEMGIIIDTKVEEVAQPNLQPTCNQLATNTISRQAAIDALRKMQTYKMFSGDDMLLIDQAGAMTELMLLPPAEPKRGKWIHHPEIGWGETWLCDQCGEKTNKRKKYIIGDIWELTGAEIREVINSQPTIQPEIVRCKDCKYWIPYDWMFSEVWRSKNMADYPEDEIGCALNDMVMKANDFCSRGERRTE